MTSEAHQNDDPTNPVKLAYTRLSHSQQDPKQTNSPAIPPQTILFIHGSESSHLEFSHVAPFLQSTYEILLIDLPAHSRSRNIPFTFANAIAGLVHLIKSQTPDKKAHIVGLSLGGYIGLELARRHPELVRTLWCTGCAPPSGFQKWMFSRSILLSGLITIAGTIANERVFWASLGKDVEPIPGFRVEVQRNQNMGTLRPVFDELALITVRDLEQIASIRIAIVAGGKGDNVEDTREAGRVLREGNLECRAFVVRDAIHWWSLEKPELFAQGVRAWIERKEMPKEFEPLLADA
jgi:pimeloyl-ACP methyl ester carboxylesterase